MKLGATPRLCPFCGYEGRELHDATGGYCASCNKQTWNPNAMVPRESPYRMAHSGDLGAWADRMEKDTDDFGDYTAPQEIIGE